MSNNNLGFSIMFLNLFKSLFITDRDKLKKNDSIKEESDNLLDIAEEIETADVHEKSEIVKLEFDYEQGILVPFGTAIKRSEDIVPKVCDKLPSVTVPESTASSEYKGEKKKEKEQKETTQG